MKFSIKFLKSIQDLEEHIDTMGEVIGEHLTQYYSEVALYGDAGPGQHPSLIDRSALTKCTADLKALRESAGGRALAKFEAWANELTTSYYRMAG